MSVGWEQLEMRRCAHVLVALLLGFALVGCSPRPSLRFAPPRFPAAEVGQSYDVTLTVGGNQTPVGQVYIARGKLPTGLALVHHRGNSTAEIGGTARETGQFRFTVAAWCLGTNVSGQTGQHVYALTVK